VTCSLECSKSHKKQKNYCDGIRDKTKFLPLKKFASSDLVSDLSLLEQAARYSVGKEVIPIKRQSSIKKKNFVHPKAFQALQRACWRRNQCKLIGLPPHFSRHCENTSYYDTKEDIIYWKVTWKLPHLEDLVENSSKVPESARICDLIEEILKKCDKSAGDDEFSVYKSSKIKDLKIMLKCEFMDRQSDHNLRYVELDIDKSLVWNLQERAVVENPIIAIAHKAHSDFFLEDDGENIMDSITEIPEDQAGFKGLNFLEDVEDMNADEEFKSPIPLKKAKISKNVSFKEDAVSVNGSSEKSVKETSFETSTETSLKASKMALSSLVAYPSSDEES